MDVIYVSSERAAGAFTYELEHDQDGPRNILIYEFGGGTFDVSILEVQENALKVKATNGKASLGGEEMDVAI